MATQPSTAELVAALRCIDGRVEVVGGEVVLMSPAGGLPSRAALTGRGGRASLLPRLVE
jgi:hypothetical protein